MLLVSDFTYVSTWIGFVYVAYVIDAYARRIGDWRCMNAVHHSDRCSQSVSIKYTERQVEAGIEPSVGSVGDSYDNALRDHQRPLRDRSDPSPRTLAIVQCCRIRDAGMGQLVQQPAASRADRKYPASRSPRTLLRHAECSSHSNLAYTNRSQANPGRFTSTAWVRSHNSVISSFPEPTLPHRLPTPWRTYFLKKPNYLGEHDTLICE